MKRTTTWKIDLVDGAHTAVFVHHFFTGVKEMHWDGELLRTIKGGLAEGSSFGNAYPFDCGGHRLEFRFGALGRYVHYKLLVDDRIVPGERTRVVLSPAFWLFICAALAIGAAYGSYRAGLWH